MTDDKQAVKTLAEQLVKAMKSVSANTPSRNYSGRTSPSTIQASKIVGLPAAFSSIINGVESSAAAGDAVAQQTLSALNHIAAGEFETITADTAMIEKVYATFGDFITLVAEDATIGDLDVETIRAGLAEVGLINIGTASIDMAQIKRSSTQTAFIHESVQGKVYIDDLAVSDASIVNLAAGTVLINNSDGELVELYVDSETGDVSTRSVSYDGNDIINSNTLNGNRIVQNSITTDRLNVNEIFASSATVMNLIGDNIDASRINTGVLSTSLITALSPNVSVGGQTIEQIATSKANIAEQNAVAALSSAVNSINSDISNLQSQIDGNITTWFYAVDPTGSNAPAVDWDTTEKKNMHLGDLYYNTESGYCWRWQLSNGVYSWQRITDTDVTKALADAAEAKDVADSKRRVFITTPVPPYDEGDLWTQGNSGDILVCVNGKETGIYVSTDWEIASKYTDDTVANNALLIARTAIKNVDVEYAKNQSTSVAPTSGWQTTAPAWEEGYYIWQRTKTTTSTGYSYSNPTCISGRDGVDGQQGPQGIPGTSITVASIQYAEGNSGTSVPSSGWQSTVPNVPAGKWLWVKTTYSDNSIATTCSYMGTDGEDGNSVAIQSVTKTGKTTTVVLVESDGTTKTLTIDDGTDGTNGTPGANGYVHTAWANSADGTVDFSTTVSANKKYLGVYTDNTAADSTNPSMYSWSLIKGADGVGISSITEYYALNNSTTAPSDSEFNTAVKTPTSSNKYVWNYELITYTNSTTSKTDKHIIANYAADGTSGRGISSITEYYAINNATTAPADSAFGTNVVVPTSENKYLWNYELISYTSGNPDKTAKRVIGIFGDKGNKGDKGDKGDAGAAGNKGDTGVGVSEIVEQYYLSTSISTQTGGSWQETQPEWVENKYIWTRSKVTWTDNTTTYTTPVLAYSINKANEVAYESKQLSLGNTASIQLLNDSVDIIGDSIDFLSTNTGRTFIQANTPIPNFSNDTWFNPVAEEHYISNGVALPLSEFVFGINENGNFYNDHSDDYQFSINSDGELRVLVTNEDAAYAITTNDIDFNIHFDYINIDGLWKEIKNTAFSNLKISVDGIVSEVYDSETGSSRIEQNANRIIAIVSGDTAVSYVKTSSIEIKENKVEIQSAGDVDIKASNFSISFNTAGNLANKSRVDINNNDGIKVSDAYGNYFQAKSTNIGLYDIQGIPRLYIDNNGQAFFNGSLTLGGANNTNGVLTVRNSNGAIVVLANNNGLFVYNSAGTAPQFYIDSSTGKAVFAGELSAATGTFNGTLSAACITSGTLSADRINAGSITGDKIDSKTITGDNIAALTIEAANIKGGTITGDKIAVGTIEASNIKGSTITGDKIAGTTITAGNIAGGTITATQLAANSVTTDQIKAGSIIADKIKNGEIKTDKLDARAVTAEKIAVGTITATEIATGTITGDRIAGTTITGSNIAGGTITGTNIAGTTITASNIVTGTITGDKIAGTTITGDKIAVGTITSNNIATGTITAEKIATGTITGDKIAGTTITGDKIAVGTINADRIKGGTLVLGGSNDINGSIKIKDISGNNLLTLNCNGIFSDDGRLVFSNYLDKVYSVGKTGLKTYTSNKNYQVNYFDRDIIFYKTNNKDYKNNSYVSGVGISLNNNGNLIFNYFTETNVYEPEESLEPLWSFITQENIVSVRDDEVWIKKITTPGNITASGNISATGTITGSNITASGNISATGTITGSNITTPGNITASGNISATGTVTGSNITASGTKSRVVSTSQYSDRLLYCYETPSPMFGDIGEGVISEDGMCYISLDPVFAQTISTNRYQVFLQCYSEGNCYVSERLGSYFVVSGTPGLRFGWEIKAKQSDFDQLRLERDEEKFSVPSQNYGEEAADYVKRIYDGRVPKNSDTETGREE